MSFQACWAKPWRTVCQQAWRKRSHPFDRNLMCGDGQPEPFMGMEEDNIPLKHLLKLQDIFRQLAILDILIFLPVIEPCTNCILVLSLVHHGPSCLQELWGGGSHFPAPLLCLPIAVSVVLAPSFFPTHLPFSVYLWQPLLFPPFSAFPFHLFCPTNLIIPPPSILAFSVSLFPPWHFRILRSVGWPPRFHNVVSWEF